MAIAIRNTNPSTTSVSGAGTLTINLTGASQPQTDDVLVIIFCRDFYTLAGMDTPTVGGSTTGVAPITGGAADAGTNMAHATSHIFVVGSAGDLTVVATTTGSGDDDRGLAVYVLSGVDTATPVDIAGNGASVSGVNPHPAPSVSTTASDDLLICHANNGGGAFGNTYTHPSGMTETYDVNMGAASFCQMGGAVLQLSASGATGVKDFTSSGSTVPYASLSIAVKAAVVAAPRFAMLRPAVVVP